MQTKYILNYSNDDKKIAKVILLGICILLDLIVLAGIIACFSTKKYLDLIIYAIVFIIALLIRISTLFMTYQVQISYNNGNLLINKHYAVKTIVLYNSNAQNLSIQKYDAQMAKNGKKYVRLCSKSCEDGTYMVELSKRKYLIYLDDYLFSLIEVSGDLS